MGKEDESATLKRRPETSNINTFQFLRDPPPSNINGFSVFRNRKFNLLKLRVLMRSENWIICSSVRSRVSRSH